MYQLTGGYRGQQRGIPHAGYTGRREIKRVIAYKSVQLVVPEVWMLTRVFPGVNGEGPDWTLISNPVYVEACTALISRTVAIRINTFIYDLSIGINTKLLAPHPHRSQLEATSFQRKTLLRPDIHWIGQATMELLARLRPTLERKCSFPQRLLYRRNNYNCLRGLENPTH